MIHAVATREHCNLGFDLDANFDMAYPHILAKLKTPMLMYFPNASSAISPGFQ